MIGKYISLPCRRCDHPEGDHTHGVPRVCARCTVHGGPCADPVTRIQVIERNLREG